MKAKATHRRPPPRPIYQGVIVETKSTALSCPFCQGRLRDLGGSASRTVYDCLGCISDPFVIELRANKQHDWPPVSLLRRATR